MVAAKRPGRSFPGPFSFYRLRLAGDEVAPRKQHRAQRLQLFGAFVVSLIGRIISGLHDLVSLGNVAQLFRKSVLPSERSEACPKAMDRQPIAHRVKLIKQGSLVHLAEDQARLLWFA